MRACRIFPQTVQTAGTFDGGQGAEKGRSLIRRTFRGMIQLLGGLGAGLAIITVLVAWRLSSGPISLAFLTPYVEKALNGPGRNFRITLGDTILTWAGWERTMDIRVVNVRAIGNDGRVIASVPELSLSFSARALLKGLVAPKRIELFNPKLSLVRLADGRFQVGFGGIENASQDILRNLLIELMAPPDPDRAMSYLSRFDIINADLTITDNRLGTSWKAPSARLSLKRDAAGGIKADVSFTLKAGKQVAQVSILGNYRPNGRRLDLGVTFSRVNPAALAELSAKLGFLAGLDLPLAGTVTASLTLDGRVKTFGFDLAGGKGYVALPVAVAQKMGMLDLAQRLAVKELSARGRVEGDLASIELDDFRVDLLPGQTVYLPAPINHSLPLKSVKGKAVYSSAGGRLKIGRLDLDLGGPTAVVTALVRGLGGGGKLTVTGKVKARNIPIDDIGRYWPESAKTDARKWIVGHLSTGTLTRADIAFKAAGDAKGGIALSKLDAEMEIEGAAVDYLPPMPKAENVSAVATLGLKRMDIAITGGGVYGLTISKGTVTITGLGEKDQYADVQMTIDGPVRDALRLIDNEPLKYASSIGIDPKRTSGGSSTKLKLDFILEKDLARDQIKVSVTSSMTDVAIGGILNQGISDGQLVLQADNRGMNVAGQVSLGITPATLAWRRNFGADAPFRSSYSVSLFLADVRRIREMGIDLKPFPIDTISGSLGAEFRYTVYDHKPNRLEATADLSKLAMDFPMLNWRKKKGVEGTAELDVRMKNGVVIDIPRFSIYAGDMALAGRASYAADGTGLSRVELKQISYGKTDMSGVLIPADDGSWTVSFYGASFDMEPFLDELLREEPANAEGGLARMRFSMSVDVGRVWLGKGRALDGVVGTFSRADNKWRSMSVDGRTGSNSPFKIKIMPGGKGARVLNITAKDAGAFIKAFGYYDDMVGGTLSITGTFNDRQPGSPLQGKLLVRNYRVIKAPALARLVSIMALTGILEAIQGDGLAFTSLDVPFVFSGGVLEIKNAKATGLSLGYTAKGKLYTYARVVDLQGTMVPAYAINTVWSKIPILGKILTGGEEGGGVFAATYTMTGPMENPKVTINPLSVLAPGILRN
ncbi:MAG TPA: hypothetical protein ENI72_03510, partial [Rhodospirillales bacterium]|nr:hypothetical protein [Rhodospirillales bacterium]